jgi:hypothetical protein
MIMIAIFAILAILALKLFIMSIRVNREGELIEAKILGVENIGPVLKVEYSVDGKVYQQNILLNKKTYGSLNHDQTIQLRVLKTNPKFITWKGNFNVYIYVGGFLLLIFLICDLSRRMFVLK